MTEMQSALNGQGRGKMQPPENLVEALRRTALDAPEKGLGIFDSRGRKLSRRTWAEVLERAAATAARLTALGIGPGRPVIVSLGTSWELVDLWLGAVLAGALPINYAPGEGSSRWSRLEGLREQLGAEHYFCSRIAKDLAAEDGRTALYALAHTPEEVAALAPARGFAPHAAASSDLAFLQLTSGSTGTPRAVAISHGALIHNALASNEAIGAPHGAPANEWIGALVSWLPLHHDMGLVGCLLSALVNGVELLLLSPRTFLARPEVWLGELGRHGHTVAPAPNFAYQTCAEHVAPAQLGESDLGRWRAALCGAEMIRPATVGEFCSTFAAAGFRPEAVRACYGLAEGTLAVTHDVAGAGLRTRPVPESAREGGLQETVSVGPPIRGVTVEVVTPDGTLVPAGRVGEVRFRGPSNFSGYFNAPAETAERLRDGWVLTGDLGFQHDGELYITGRIKDLIITRGRNVMPHELEWCAESVTAGGGRLRAGAFSIHDPREGELPVIVAEVETRELAALQAMEAEIRSRIGHEHGLLLADVAFVRRGQLPKTTSGKVQRGELRRQYLDKRVERLDSVGPEALFVAGTEPTDPGSGEPDSGASRATS